MLGKSVLMATTIVLFMLSASDMAQQAVGPATQPIDENDPMAVRNNFIGLSQRTAQRLSVQFKMEFGASDQDIAILLPLIQKCIETRGLAISSDALSRYGARNVNSANADENPLLAGPVIGPGLIDLDRMLADKATTIEAIKAQIGIIRKIHQKANEDYDTACKALRSHVTQRQEAFLMLNDVLN